MNSRLDQPILSGLSPAAVVQKQLFEYMNTMQEFLSAGRDFDPEELRKEMQGFVDYFATVSVDHLSQSAKLAAGCMFATLAQALFANTKQIDEEMIRSYLKPAVTLLMDMNANPLCQSQAQHYCSAQIRLASAFSFAGEYVETESRILQALEVLRDVDGKAACDLFEEVVYTLEIQTHFTSRDLKPWTPFYKILSQHSDVDLQRFAHDVRELSQCDTSQLFHLKVMHASIDLLLKHFAAEYFPSNSIVQQLKQSFCLQLFNGWQSKLTERIAHLETLQGLLGESKSLMIAMSQRIIFLERQVESLEAQLGEWQAVHAVSSSSAGLFSQAVEIPGPEQKSANHEKSHVASLD
tara:strand:+ start:525 stop:1577 length:1053 start_codon:yes stop_codon:yes gene_type:complete